MTSEYFPSENATWEGSGLVFGNDQGEWEADRLRRMHEPSLYACNSNTADPQYRFIWDRSFHEPIAARLVVHKDGSGTLFLRMLAHSGIPLPPKRGQKAISEEEWYRIKLDRQVEVTPDQVRQALMFVGQIKFWNPGSEKNSMVDGSDWIFETKVRGQYRLVDFRILIPQAAKDFGLYLVRDLAKVVLPQGTIY